MKGLYVKKEIDSYPKGILRDHYVQNDGLSCYVQTIMQRNNLFIPAPLVGGFYLVVNPTSIVPCCLRFCSAAPNSTEYSL